MSEEPCLAAKRQRESSQTCNVWDTQARYSRAESAAGHLNAPSGRGCGLDANQTFHVWLPSRYAFSVSKTFSKK